MTTWTPFTVAAVTTALPTATVQAFAAWIAANPTKANRLAEIVEEVRKAVRDAVESNPANVMDTTWDTVPNAAFRHALNLVIFDLATEMGGTLDAYADSVATRADIWLRMVASGSIPIACDDAVRGGTPTYVTPAEREARPARVLLEGVV